MELTTLLRPLGLVAGPAVVVALVLMIGAVATAGDAVDASPLATASSAVLLVALLGMGAAALCALARLRDSGRGVAGPALAVVGTALVFGGGWATLFVLPGLAAEAPDVLDSGLAGVQIGYIASYVVFSVGWVWTGVSMARSRMVPTWLGVLVAIAGALAFVPAPEAFRLLVIGVAATLLTRRIAAAAQAPVPQPA